MAGRDFLLIADAVAPLGDGVSPLGAAGLSRALAATGPPDDGSHAGQRRRRRAASPAWRGGCERSAPPSARARTSSRCSKGGRCSSDAQLLVLAATPDSRAETAALLAGAVRSLATDKLIAPEVTIGWGEPAAAALSATSAAVRLFVLPTGRLGPSLAPPEAEILGPLLLGDESASHSLVALGCLGANAIVAPSPSAARATESDPGLASRASDEPVIAVRFGCDDPPNDPASDPALPANFSAAALAGKAECRRAIARRCSLALGPRTLLLTTGPAAAATAGRTRSWRGIERLAPFDVATIIVPRGEPEIDRARAPARAQAARPRRAVPGRRCQPTNGWRAAPPTPSCSATITIGSAARPDWPCSTERFPSRPRSARTATTWSTTTRGSRTGHAILYSDRGAVRDRERRPARPDLARGRRRLDAAGEDADDERAALVGRRRGRHRDRGAVPGTRSAALAAQRGSSRAASGSQGA